VQQSWPHEHEQDRGHFLRRLVLSNINSDNQTAASPDNFTTITSHTYAYMHTNSHGQAWGSPSTFCTAAPKNTDPHQIDCPARGSIFFAPPTRFHTYMLILHLQLSHSHPILIASTELHFYGFYFTGWSHEHT
jgi:hypothetical protein